MKPKPSAHAIMPYILLIGFLIIGIALARPLHNFIHVRLVAFQTSLVALVEKSSGLKLRYDQLNPSILLQAELSGFRLLRSDDSVFFSADKVRVSYNIFQFLLGAPLEAVRSIDLEGSLLSWDESRDTIFRPTKTGPTPTGDIKPGVAWLRSSLNDLSAVLPKGLRLSFIETQVDLKGKDWQAGFQVSRADLSSSTEQLSFSLDVNIAVENLAFLRSLGAVSGNLKAEGTFFRSNRQIQAQVSTNRFQTSLGVLAPQKFAAVLGTDALRFRKVEDSQAFDLQLAWIFATDTINLDLTTAEWRPSRAFEPDSTLNATMLAVLNSNFTSTISAAYQLKTGDMAYKFDINGHGATDQSLPVIVIAAGKGTNRGLTNSKIQLEIPGIRTAYQGDIDFASPHTNGLLDIEVSAPLLSVPVALKAGLQGNPNKAGLSLVLTDVELHTGETILKLGSVPLWFNNRRLAFSINGSVLKNETPSGTLNLEGSIGTSTDTPFLLLGGTVHDTPLQASGGLIRTIVALAGSFWAEKTVRALPTDLFVNGSFELKLDHVLTLGVHNIVIAAPNATPLFTGSLHFLNETLKSENAKLNIGIAPWSIDAQMHFTPKGPTSLDLDFQPGTPEAMHIAGSLEPDQTFELQGPYGLYMGGDLSGGQIKAFARIENAPIPSFGRASRLAGTAEFTQDQKDNWLLTIRDADINNIAWNPVFPDRVGRLIIRNALFYPTSGHIGEVRYQDGASTMVGSGDVHYSLPNLPDLQATINLDGRPSVAQPVLSLAPENLALTVGITRGLFHSTISLNNSPLQRFNDSGFRGAFNMEAGIDAPLSKFWENISISGSAKSSNAFWFKDHLTAKLDFHYANSKLDLNSGTISLPGKRLFIDSLVVNSVAGTMDLISRFDNPENPSFKPVAIAGKASWNPQPIYSTNILFNGFKGTISAQDVIGIDGIVRNYEAHFTGANKILDFSEALNNAFRGHIQEDGGFLVQLQQALPLTATISGFVRNNKIEANAFNINFDLSTVSGLLNLSIFRMTGGNLTGSLRVVGDLFDPDFYGSLRVNALKANFSMTPEALSAPLGYLVFEEKKIRLLGVQVAAASGGGARVDGDFTLSRLNITSFLLNFETFDNRGIHIVSNFSNIVVDGRGRGRFSVAYSPAVIDLRGQLTVEDTKLQISQQPAPTKSKAVPPESDQIPIVVNLAIKSGKSVEFFWPSSTLPLLRTTLDINQSAVFSLNQLANTWSLIGNLATRGGEIMYLKRNFFLRQASISFNENQTKDFDPIINARAETKIIVDNQSANVSLIFRDSFLSHLQPRIESDLLLTTDQLNGVISGDLVKLNQSSSATYNAFLVNSLGYATVALMPNVESKIRDFLGLDLFSLRSNLLPNIASSALINNQNPLDNQRTSLGQYLDNTTLQFGKFLGTDVYIEFMTQFRAISTLGTKGNLAGLTADFGLSMEWETPFFNLQWTLAPKNALQPELSDFIRNNTFQFSWQIR